MNKKTRYITRLRDSDLVLTVRLGGSAQIGFVNRIGRVYANCSNGQGDFYDLVPKYSIEGPSARSIWEWGKGRWVRYSVIKDKLN